MDVVAAVQVEAAEVEPEADVAADEVDHEVEAADVDANLKAFFCSLNNTQYNNRILKFVNIFTRKASHSVLFSLY